MLWDRDSRYDVSFLRNLEVMILFMKFFDLCKSMTP